jgi:hypothetical protein
VLDSGPALWLLSEGSMIDQLIMAFYMTMELWIFLGLLLVAILVEQFVVKKQQPPIDI